MHKALQLKISADDMTVTMMVKKAALEKQKEHTYPGLPDVLSACEELNIVYGIDNDTIVNNLKYKDKEIVIAEGKRPLPTVHDKVAYTFEDMRNKQFTPSVLADGKVNFYEMVKFKIVQKDELLVFVKKGRAGEPGLTTTGREVPVEKYTPMTVDLLRKYCGPNTELTPDGGKAVTIGIPQIASDGKVSVNDTYVIQGDVDFSTGSIDYEGPVIVKGNLTNNFSVKSKKDVIIEGIVDGGIVDCGGMVTLLGGMNKGKIKCPNNVVAKYIYASEVECGNAVIVDEAILNSQVKAKTVIAKGEPKSTKSGQISGGSIEACNFVWAKTLGSPSSNFTDIHVLSFIDRNPLDLLLAEHKKYSVELDKIYRTAKVMEELKRKTANLPPNFQANHIKIVKAKLALEKKLKQIEQGVEKIEKLIDKEDLESDRKIYVSASLHPKVLLQIFEKKVQTRQDYGPTIVFITEEDERITIKPATEKMELPKEFND